MSSSYQAGFTLIELILSISIITILTGITLPIFQSFQNRNDLDITAQSETNSLRRAFLYARSVNGDSQWGVNAQSGTITVYKGSSYATRDTNYDETTVYPTNISLSGLQEINFSKVSGVPNSSGSITFSNTGGDSKTVVINAKGFTTY